MYVSLLFYFIYSKIYLKGSFFGYSHRSRSIRGWNMNLNLVEFVLNGGDGLVWSKIKDKAFVSRGD